MSSLNSPDPSSPTTSTNPALAANLPVPPPLLPSRKSFRTLPVNLTDAEEDDDWEPSSEEPDMSLEEIRESIAGWEDEMKARGRPVSGRTIVVVHSLPYVCTLHPSKNHSTSLDNHILPGAFGGPNPHDESLIAPPSSHPATPGATTPSGAMTPFEIHAGDPLLRLRALHAPTNPNTLVPAAPGTGSSTPSGSPPSLSPPPPATINLRFPDARSSQQPSSHPPCPPSRASSPDGHTSAYHHGGPTSLPEDLYSESHKHRWVLHPRRGHAALNSGLRSLTGRPLTVVGRPSDLMRSSGEALGEKELSDVSKRDLEKGLKDMAGEDEGGIGCVPVWMDDKVHSNFYEGMCKTYLWPIFHYIALPDDLDKQTELSAWNAYYETNLIYATKVAEQYRPGDLIWIHDYHLLLVPKMLRTLLPDASPYISLFLHCPFPSSEYFRNLPRREAILDGMLGCNLVVFQTHSYARHFLSSCVRVMGYEAGSGGVDAKGNITRIAHCPIGIDVENVQLDRKSPGVAPKIEALRRLYEGKKIIVGRDKLDPTKGVLPKLRAFDKFLRDYPNWKHKVVLIQVTSPSPGDSPELGTKVSELVDQINATHGSLEFQPVHHYHQTVARDEYFALLSVADLALITSTRDGMNTTAMEYIICQAENKGPLIVSEFTGVSAVLSKAVKVNPWDLGGVARAINNCLLMPEEEKALRHGVLSSIVESQTASVWAATNVLKLLESLQGEQATQNTPALDQERLVAQYTKAGKRLLLFDYDGTLTPIVKDPAMAVPSKALLDALPKLCADPKNVVYIISGRDGDFLQQHLGHIDNLGMSAEHGCFIRGPGMKEWVSLTDELKMDWKKDVLQIFKYYEARTQGSMVEKKLSSITFHYRNADPVFGLFQAKECQAMLESMQESLPIDVLVGKKNVEVRPAHTNKGEIVQRLLYLHPETEFCMCAGDDKTDEDMFHSMARIFSSASAGGQPTISPPDSLTLFPSLATTLPLLARSEDPDNLELQAVESKLDPASMWMIAIEKDGQQRMTMANALLPTAESMVELLVKLSTLT